MSGDATGKIRAYVAGLERAKPTADTEAFVAAVLDDPDIGAALARDDATAAANALRAIVVRVYGEAVPKRVANAFRQLDIPLRLKREDP